MANGKDKKKPNTPEEEDSGLGSAIAAGALQLLPIIAGGFAGQQLGLGASTGALAGGAAGARGAGTFLTLEQQKAEAEAKRAAKKAEEDAERLAKSERQREKQEFQAEQGRLARESREEIAQQGRETREALARQKAQNIIIRQGQRKPNVQIRQDSTGRLVKFIDGQFAGPAVPADLEAQQVQQTEGQDGQIFLTGGLPEDQDGAPENVFAAQPDPFLQRQLAQAQKAATDAQAKADQVRRTNPQAARAEERRVSNALTRVRQLQGKIDTDVINKQNAVNKAVGEARNALEVVREVEQLFPEVETGILAGPAQRLGEAVGIADPAFTRLKTKVGKQLVEFVKQTSGLAVTDQERKALSDLLPTVQDDDDQFKVKLQEFKGGVEKLLLQKFTESGVAIPDDFIATPETLGALRTSGGTSARPTGVQATGQDIPTVINTAQFDAVPVGEMFFDQNGVLMKKTADDDADPVR